MFVLANMMPPASRISVMICTEILLFSEFQNGWMGGDELTSEFDCAVLPTHLIQ